MINFRLLKLSDSRLWAALSVLTLTGFAAIFSATYRLQIRAGDDPFLFVKKQFFSLLIALIALALFTYFDYKHLKKIAAGFYAATLLLLIFVLFGGSSAAGAQRWFQLGPFSFQPSEISKLTIIISLAAFLSSMRKNLNGIEVGYLLLLVGLPFLLVFKQPDLGTALIFLVIFIGMLAVSDISPRFLVLAITPLFSILLRPIIYLWIAYLIVLVLALFLSRARFWDWVLVLGINVGVGVAVPLFWGMLKEYQRQRITSFLNPAADPYGAGYHTLQSVIAVGSGGLFGKGFLSGSQTQLQFIPEQHSDFVFSAIGEEFGFLGSIAVLGLFGVYIWRALAIAGEARDGLGKMLAGGIAVMTGFHVLANIGMAVGILPVVGIPLPFLSFGGSSLFLNFAAAGILQSIAMRRQKLVF